MTTGLKVFDVIQQKQLDDDRLFELAEVALRHALTCSLGLELKPVKGNLEKDEQAIAVLRRLEARIR